MIPDGLSPLGQVVAAVLVAYLALLTGFYIWACLKALTKR